MPTNILLLQGPVGPFFKRWSRHLQAQGHNVYKVNLNGGDAFFFCGENSINYSGTPDNWPKFLESRILQLKIDRIYLFGDCRSYHVVAVKQAKRLGIKLSVFEEGYLRPDYVTLEEGGVNGNSSLCCKPVDYKHVAGTSPEPKHIAFSFWFTALYSVLYYIACSFSGHKFPEYQHHRPLNIWTEGKYWIKGFIRKIVFRFTERRAAARIINGNEGYFLVPLQVHADMQVRRHSTFNSIEHFIREVVDSFANHADKNQLLVLKHHPLDRGYRDFSSLIKQLEDQHDIRGRLVYLHDWHLPTLLKHAKGVVTINSTVGISSLHHGTPVKALGKAIYDIEGLCSRDNLEHFWSNPGKINSTIFNNFRSHLLNSNQINGNFYRLAPQSRNHSGLHIPDDLRHDHDMQPISGSFTKTVTSH